MRNSTKKKNLELGRFDQKERALHRFFDQNILFTCLEVSTDFHENRQWINRNINKSHFDLILELKFLDVAHLIKWGLSTGFILEKPSLQNKFTLLKIKFFPAKIPISKIQKKNLAGKNLLCKGTRSFI